MVTVPWEFVIEVLRLVGAEALRPILDQRLGMRDASLEGEAVDEGLQRGTGRAHGVGHVDGAGALVIEVPGRADMRDDGAGYIFDGNECGGNPRADAARMLARRLFEERVACDRRWSGDG